MKETRTCPVCNKNFESRNSPSRIGRGIYCSLACRGGNNHITHGHTLGGKPSATYNSWSCMVARCTKPYSSKYHRYGAIGITVCERWLAFENFLEDMGERPKGCTIDRIDGNAGYFPENCRWADIKTQQRNTKNNVFVEFQGERRCVSEWAEIYGLDKTLLCWRIRNGWTPEAAFLTKPKRGNRIKRGLHT
jgi:hypothetical protein